MQVVNINEAKTQLIELIDRAVNGEPFIITKAGKPLVKVVAFDANQSVNVNRLGFLKEQIAVPDDFDQMGRNEIEHLFNGNS